MGNHRTDLLSVEDCYKQPGPEQKVVCGSDATVLRSESLRLALRLCLPASVRFGNSSGKAGSYHFEDGIIEHGYYASKLVEEFPLSQLGAYNYLIYLREDPEHALANLKAGLPKK